LHRCHNEEQSAEKPEIILVVLHWACEVADLLRMIFVISLYKPFLKIRRKRCFHEKNLPTPKNLAFTPSVPGPGPATGNAAQVDFIAFNVVCLDHNLFEQPKRFGRWTSKETTDSM
jgi:hypothetical protein